MPGGDAFECTGTGLEKFLGFLIALVILAFYLGILQVVLTFVGFNLLGGVGRVCLITNGCGPAA